MRLTVLLVFILIMGFIILSVSSAWRESLTYDEIVDIEEGKNIWENKSFNEPYNPPLIREIQTFPLLWVQPKSHGELPNREVLSARLATILFGVLLIVFVSTIAYALFGKTQSVIAAFLMALEPNTLGHGHYVTFDVGFSLFFLLYYIYFWQTMSKPSSLRSIILGMSLGFLLSSKVSAIPFVFASTIVSASIVKHGLTVRLFLKEYKKIIGVVITALIIVWTSYFFTSSVIIKPRQDTNRVSEKLLMYAQEKHNGILKSIINFAKYQPVPLGEYFAIIKNNSVRQLSEARYFFLGAFYPSHRWYFLPVYVLLKTPLPLLFLFIISIRSVNRKKAERRKIYLILVPVIVVMVISSFSSMMPWARYILPIYPFVVLVASDAVAVFNDKPLKIIFGFLLIWYGLGTLSYFPHFISYANEIAGTRSEHYKLFADSNIDWGQALPDLAAYVNSTKPRHVSFSYFGRDNGNPYGLVSNKPYGSYKFDDICAFHEIDYPGNPGPRVSAISISNWYYCGFYRNNEFSPGHLVSVVGDSILILK